jgi:hypothetical protein
MSDAQADPRARLEQLEERERALSARRRALHDRIDFIRGGSASPDAETLERLERLLDEEREVSATRAALHAQIDDLRVFLGLPRFVRGRRGMLG